MSGSQRKPSKPSFAAFLTVILLICAAVLVTHAPASATTDLVASWHMDEGSGAVVSDSSGNGFHGTLDNTAIWGPGDTACNGALHFDGTSIVTVPRDAALEPAQLTLQAMVKASGTPGQYRYIASKNYSSNWASYALYTGGVGGLVFYIGSSSTFALTPSATSTTIWDGNWHHVVGTYDGSAVRLYVDGDEVAVTSTSLTIAYDSSKNFTIGHYAAASVFEHHFVGAIDAVKVWNRALTAAEIQQLDPCAPETPPNTPPSATAGGPYDAGEGDPVALLGASANDLDGDSLSYAWTVDSADCTFDDATALKPTLTCAENGAFNATLVVDDGQVTATDSAPVTVHNVPPAVGPINAPLAPVIVGSQISVEASFTDPGLLDTHTGLWDWGDSLTSSATISTSGGAGLAGGNHTYTAPGVYTLALTVTDDDGDANQAVYQYVVVYDPSGGFVTGGGWIDSPAGACQLSADCQSATGKAQFGFVSRYEKGATVPSGNTHFNFKAGNLGFDSDAYDWLVVTGSNYARFKGTGTINGQLTPDGNPFKFQIWAGDATGTSGADTFRIKIWYEQNGSETIVYDNGMDQPLGGGNIHVHTN